jgi:hypothetical protein
MILPLEKGVKEGDYLRSILHAVSWLMSGHQRRDNANDGRFTYGLIIFLKID